MSDNRESESPEKGPKNDYNPSQIYGCVIAEQTMSLATDTENAPAKITSDQSPASISQQTKLYLAGEWVNLPSVLITDPKIFYSVISKESFLSLSQASKEHLKRYISATNEDDLNELLNCIFTSDKHFFFGNPLNNFFGRIHDGYFTAADHVQLRDHKKVLYDHYIRHYHMNLLKKLLINRHAILEMASKQKLSSPIRIPSKRICYEKKMNKHTNIRQRARVRSNKMIDECCAKAGGKIGASSDESEIDNDSVTDCDHAVVTSPENAHSTLFVGKFAFDLDLYQPIKMKKFAELYKEYCYLRETEPDCPSLDISDIMLEEVYERTGISFQTERNFSKITEQNLRQFQGKRRQQKEKN